MLQSSAAPRGRDAHTMRSDFILSNKQGGGKCTEDRFTLKWRTNPTSAIASPLTHIQSIAFTEVCGWMCVYVPLPVTLGQRTWLLSFAPPLVHLSHLPVCFLISSRPAALARGGVGLLRASCLSVDNSMCLRATT